MAYLIILAKIPSIPQLGLLNQLERPISIFTKSLAALVLLLLGVFSVTATHDLLSWNRENGWEQLSAHITIPEHFTGGSIDFFLQNPSNEELWFDDLKITIVKF